MQMIELKLAFLAAEALCMQVPILTGFVQTDKLHVHKQNLNLEVAYTLISYQAATYIKNLADFSICSVKSLQLKVIITQAVFSSYSMLNF